MAAGVMLKRCLSRSSSGGSNGERQVPVLVLAREGRIDDNLRAQNLD